MGYPAREMIRLVPVLLLVFKIWMLIDAIRRREPYYWLMIIFFIPGGSVIYFLMVKVRDFDLPGIAAQFKRPPSVAALREAYRRTPCLDSVVDLAEGLNRAGEHAEATQLFAEVLEREPENLDALFGTGEAHVGSENFAAAIEPLSGVIDRQPGFRDFAAWPLLAHALYSSGETERCLSLLRGLVASNPRLPHATLLAYYLIAAGEKTEARRVLTTAIEDQRAAPRFVRRGQFRSMLEARRMLEECRDET